MFETTTIQADSKAELYAQLAEQAKALLHDESDRVANAANLASLIFNQVPDLNWAGFYFFDGTELVVGPFQGKPACVRIPLGKGVCGTAASERKTQLVEDVNAFEGHIACDPDSQSEIVVPLYKGDELIGVLDIDSPRAGRFDAEDQSGFERLAGIYVETLCGLAQRR